MKVRTLWPKGISSSESGEGQRLAELLDATLDATSDGILVVTAQGRILLFNRRFAEIWALPERVLGTGDDSELLAYVLEQLADPGGFVKKVMDVYAQPDEASFDLIEFKDGRVVERRSRPQRLSESETVRVWSFHDVTERRLADREIERSLSLLRSMLDAAADGILVVDLFGRIVTFNQRFREMWRLPLSIMESRDARIGLKFVLDQVQDPGRFERKVLEVVADAQAQSYIWVEFKDGRLFEGYSRPQQIGEKVVGRVWSFRDTTERSRIEERGKLYAEALGRLREIVVITDPEGVIRETFRSAGSALGYSARELSGSPISRLHGPADASLARRVLDRLRSEPSWQGETDLRRKDGSCFRALVAAASHSDPHGSARSIIWIHRAAEG
jgi:PAS domain S-box-containing protein